MPHTCCQVKKEGWTWVWYSPPRLRVIGMMGEPTTCTRARRRYVRTGFVLRCVASRVPVESFVAFVSSSYPVYINISTTKSQTPEFPSHKAHSQSPHPYYYLSQPYYCCKTPSHHLCTAPPTHPPRSTRPPNWVSHTCTPRSHRQHMPPSPD